MRKELSEAEIAVRRARLEDVVAQLVEASVRVASDDELASFDGSTGLDATVVPLFSRGPSKRAGTSASDPDGGWYVREGDHRDVVGPAGKKLRKLFWAQEAAIVTMGRAPGSVPTHPNLVLAVCLTRPGEDPGGTGVRMLASVRRRGWPAGYVGADRGYTQVRPEHFHLPARALGYSVVMDYRGDQLGRQANSQGAVMVDGCFYCPAMPEEPRERRCRSSRRGHRHGALRRAHRGQSTLAAGAQRGSRPRRLRASRVSRTRRAPPSELPVAP